MGEAVVAIHFKDMHVDETVKDVLEKRCHGLSDEFPELTHLEVTLVPDGSRHAASGHATGKATEVATHAAGEEPRQAAEKVLDKLRAQLRRTHDKRIFAHRRQAHRSHPRRS